MKLIITILSLLFAVLISCKQNINETESKYPTVKILSLENDAVVLDSVLIEIAASDENGISKIEIYIDGETDSTRILFNQPYRYIWLTPQIEDSSKHQIYAIAYTVAGNSSQTTALTINVHKFQAPSLLQVIYMSDELVKLKWKDNSIDETEYRIDVSLGLNNFVFAQNAPANMDSAVIPGTYIKDSTYYFRVTAKKNDKTATSLEIGYKLVFQAPIISGVNFLSDTSVQLYWFDNSTFERNFAIEQSEDGTKYVVIDSAEANKTSAIVYGTYFSGNTYSFRIRANSANSATDLSPAISKQFSFMAPNGLVIDSMIETSLVLSWANSNRSVSRVFIEQSTNSLNYSVIDSVDFPLTKVKVGGIFSTDTTYYFRVRSKSKYNVSAYSNTAEQNLIFPTPSDLRIIPISQNEINLLWSDNSIFHPQFIIERSGDGGNTFDIISTTNQVSIVDIGLLREKIYSYRVKAFTQYNKSAYSPEIRIEHNITDIQKLYTVNLGKDVHSIAFSRDGSMVAAVGMSYALKIWGTENGTLIQDLSYKGSNETSLGWPFQVAFSADNNYVASNADGGNQATVNLWRIIDGALIQTFRSSGGGDARSICFSNDGNKIFAGNFSGVVRIWDITKDTTIKNLLVSGNDIVSLVYVTHDGEHLVTGGYGFPGTTNQGIQTWRTNDWTQHLYYNGFQSEYYSVSTDEKFFTSGGSVRSLATGAITSNFTSFSDGQTCLSYDNKILLGKHRSGSIVIGQVSTTSVNVTKSILAPDIYSYPAIACSPNSYTFAAAGSEVGSIDLWSMKGEWKSF